MTLEEMVRDTEYNFNTAGRNGVVKRRGAFVKKVKVGDVKPRLYCLMSCEDGQYRVPPGNVIGPVKSRNKR